MPFCGACSNGATCDSCNPGSYMDGNSVCRGEIYQLKIDIRCTLSVCVDEVRLNNMNNNLYVHNHTCKTCGYTYFRSKRLDLYP